jgi:hypothetical protein
MNPNNPEQIRMTRRGFLSNVLALAFLTPFSSLLSGCKNQSTATQAELNRQPVQVNQPLRQTNNQLESELRKIRELEENYRQKIKKIRQNPEEFGIPKEDFYSFMNMVDKTSPAISLTYYNNPFIEAIRRKPLHEAIMFMIAALDVEHSKRYNISYACNTYALDILRALLGNEIIGDRYDKQTNKPVSIGIKDIPEGEINLSKYNSKYPYMNSDMIDNWMRNYGGKFGWKKHPEHPSLIPKNSIGVFCTSWKKLIAEKKRDPQYLGHMGVIFHPDPNQQSIIARTQASTHVPFEVLYPNHPVVIEIIKGGFNLYYNNYPFGNY